MYMHVACPAIRERRAFLNGLSSFSTAFFLMHFTRPVCHITQAHGRRVDIDRLAGFLAPKMNAILNSYDKRIPIDLVKLAVPSLETRSDP